MIVRAESLFVLENTTWAMVGEGRVHWAQCRLMSVGTFDLIWMIGARSSDNDENAGETKGMERNRLPG
jgi:hypothetical protein